MDTQLDLSLPLWEFYRTMGAVLMANLLTVGFVWAMYNYSQREKRGIEKQPGSGLYLGVIVMVFGFMFGGLVAAGMII